MSRLVSLTVSQSVSQSVTQFRRRLVRNGCYSQRNYVISKVSFAHGSQPRTRPPSLCAGLRLWLCRRLCFCLSLCRRLWRSCSRSPILGFKLIVRDKLGTCRSQSEYTLNHVRLVSRSLSRMVMRRGRQKYMHRWILTQK